MSRAAATRRSGEERDVKRRRGATPTGKPKPRRPAAPAAAGRPPKATPARIAAAKRKFERGVVVRREAVKKGRPLTPGATHEITGADATGRPVLKRRRFAAR